MKTKVLVGVLLFLIVINLSTIGVFVYHILYPPPKEGEIPPFEGRPPMGPGGGASPMMNVKPEVMEHIHKLMAQFHEDVNGLQQQVFEIEDSTVAMLKNNPPPMDRVNENLKRASDLRLLISQKAVHNLLAAKSLLPPEHQDMFLRAIIQARPQAGRMGGEMGRGPMWGRPMGGGPGKLDSNKSH